MLSDAKVYHLKSPTENGTIGLRRLVTGRLRPVTSGSLGYPASN